MVRKDHPPRKRGLRRSAVIVGMLAAAGFTSWTYGVQARAQNIPVFGRDTALTQGAEPSLAVDDNAGSTGLGNVYVSAIGTADGFPNEWHSYNDGSTWSAPVDFDNGTLGTLPGGDQDIAVFSNGNVIVDDLDVSHATIQVSTDHGQSFNSGTATAPEDDRPWLTTNGSSIAYVIYHDFVGEVPIVCESTDGGNTFTTCNQAFAGPNTNPSVTTATQAPNCAENTIPGRPLGINPVDGSLNFIYSCSTAQGNAGNPPYGALHDYYLAKSVGPLVNGQAAAYTQLPVFIADTSGGKAPTFANIFGTVAIDSAGNYYALLDGTADDNNVLENPYHVYLTTSTNGGTSWSTPRQVDSETSGAGTHVFAHMVVTKPGNVDVVWLGTPSTGEPNGVCGTTAQSEAGMAPPCTDATTGGLDGLGTDGTTSNWSVYMAQSVNALSATPQYSVSQVSPGFIHQGEICTNGLVCGQSDRSLLDYISVGVDCGGDAHVAYANNYTGNGNDQNGTAIVHEADQTSGETIAPPSTCPSVVAVTPEAPLVPLLPVLGAGAGLAIVARRRGARRADAGGPDPSERRAGRTS